MTTLREAAQMALDALDLVTDLTSYDDEVYEAIDALRAALAQPEQEPVAWMVITMGEVTSMQPHMIAAEMLDGTHQLYTAPPQREWQGLTEEERLALWINIECDLECLKPAQYARAIEAKLKEKNT